MAAVNYIGTKPSPNPVIGDIYVDDHTFITFVFDGLSWSKLSSPDIAHALNYTPTADELNTYPALKSAWEEYMIVRKLLGV